VTLRQRLLPHPILSVVIWGLWADLNGASLGQILLGAMLGLVLPVVLNRFWPDPPMVRRPLVIVRLLTVVLVDIVVANLHVARRVLGPLDQLRPGLVEVPLDIDDPFVATLLGSIVALTPGTVSIEIDRAHARLYLHALDVADHQALVRTIKTRYEAPLKEIFGC
jgi:multicomponent K+:H+ antiporter subunit E